MPPQQQAYPGLTSSMHPRPRDEMREYRAASRLIGKRALVTGGDSGIGRAVAIGFAKEGADVAIAYLSEDEDAEHTKACIEAEGRKCVAIRGDLTEEAHCLHAVETTVDELGSIDILVNNVAFQKPVQQFEDITTLQWDRTFRTNVYSYFWCAREAVRHMEEGGVIINTSSVNGLRGNQQLIDYAATKGAVNALTYSLAQSLLDRRIRVNAVAPGPVWTPLIPSTMPVDKVEHFGEQVPMERAAHPDEIAPSYIFFASDQDSSYYTGEIFAAIGGETMPG